MVAGGSRMIYMYVDVFVDDFVGLAQTDSTPRRLSRILMHAIDDVLRPLESSDSAFRSQPISVKKLLKGIVPGV